MKEILMYFLNSDIFVRSVSQNCVCKVTCIVFHCDKDEDIGIETKKNSRMSLLVRYYWKLTKHVTPPV